MVKLHLKKLQYVFGIFLLLIGIVFYVWMTGPIQYVGIGFIFLGYVYFVFMVYSKYIAKHEGPFRSRIRDQMMKSEFQE